MMEERGLNMEKFEFGKPYQLQQIIDIMSKDILKYGFSNTNFSLYSKNDNDIARPDLICYLELSPTITDDDEEVFPNFVIKESLVLFYYGQQFEDVLMNVSHQKKLATIDDYVAGLNYYMDLDTFKDF
jgi:hypothetical protein